MERKYLVQQTLPNPDLLWDGRSSGLVKHKLALKDINEKCNGVSIVDFEEKK
jgi:hypothetical protein